ncbi:MAG: hypothetical protein WC028_24475 [Candidatus Obscuribacterales bacterium]|jgi:CheY-like chemotaxis protein
MTKIEQPSLKLDAEDTYRILALENPENIDKLKEAWKSAGHQVVPVLTISQAMAFLDSRDHVDLIISAVHLEEESVFEFLQRIKAPDSMHKDVAFVMLCMEPNTLAPAINKSTELAGKLLGADKYIYMQEFDAELLIAEVEPLLLNVPMKETEANPNKP